MPQDLIEKIFRSANTYKKNTACVFEGRDLSYADFFSLVESFRSAIRSQKDSVIAVYADQVKETYAAILAILFEGKAFLPLNPKHPLQRNLEILKSAGTQSLFYFGRESIFEGFTVLEANGKRVLSAPVKVDPNQNAYLFFTSGSTGKSKGVPITRGALSQFCESLNQIPGMDFKESDRFLQMFELTFDLANFGFFVPLSVGATIVPVTGNQKTFLAVAEVLQKQEITVALMVPSLLTFLSPYFDELRIPALRLNLFCGEGLDSLLVQAWLPCVPEARVWNVYGPTEATIFCSYYEINRSQSPLAHAGTVSIGEPMVSTSFALIDEEGKTLEGQGELGELCLEGPQVTRGYWEDEEKNRTAFLDLSNGKRAYRTGDLVMRLGKLYQYVGRADFQIKINGYRVELGEIEFHAKRLGVFENAVVIPEQINGMTRLHLYYQCKEKLNANEEKEVLQNLSQVLPPYMVPHTLRWRPAFPLNTNQKIDRKKLCEA